MARRKWKQVLIGQAQLEEYDGLRSDKYSDRESLWKTTNLATDIIKHYGQRLGETLVSRALKQLSSLEAKVIGPAEQKVLE